ncbi:MAG TPA: ABC transporter permease [Trueperaceae bacterium]|nr:ABC transporter permease [Trueperaceae bacterium]
MFRYVLARAVQMLPLLAVISFLSFVLIHLVPGDPAVIMAGMQAPDSVIEQVRQEMGLDRPFHTQVLDWYQALVIRGDLGRSYFFHAPVTQALAERLPFTLTLAALSMLVATIVGVTLGSIAASAAGTFLDRAILVMSLVGIAMPGFWVGLVMMFYFAVDLGWFPTGGYTPPIEGVVPWLRSLALPVFSLALLESALITRMTRASLLDVLGEDYIRTAHAKGVGHRRVLTRHGLRNSLIPIITIVGTSFGNMIGGAVIIEMVFSLPGIGRLVTMAILSRDYPLIQGTMLVIGIIYVVVNLIVDVLYVAVDPRISYA